MGIPRKGSRRTEVNGRAYRYLVKESHVEGHKDQKELVVVVQEDAEKPGNVLRFRATYGFAVTANTIEAVVQQAISFGWEPSKRGPAFDLPDQI